MDQPYKHSGVKATPEFVLACACCAWPLTGARLETISGAVTSVADWDRFLRVVDRHRIAGLAYHALVRSAACIPEPIKARLASQAQEIARQNLYMTAETIRFQRLFNEAEIPVLFVKGATLAQLAYGALSVKHAMDIDFLVLPKDAERAYGILEDAGYEAPNGRLNEKQRQAMFHGTNEASLIHNRTGLKIELHWALTENPLLLRGINALAPTQEVYLAPGQRVRTLATENLFSYLCVHGAYHAWMRLKWLADLNAFIATLADGDLDYLYRRASKIGAGPSAAQALLLAQELLGLDLPRSLDAELRHSKRNRMLLKVAKASLTGRDCETEVNDRPFGTMRISLSHFLLGRGWRYALAQIRTIMFTPRDIIDYPLPAYLYFAQPVLRVPLHIWRLILNRGRGGPLPATRKRR